MKSGTNSLVRARLTALTFLLFLIMLTSVSLAQTLPALPRAYVDTTMPVQTGTTYTVTSCTNLQTTINSAALGDTIIINSSLTCVGQFTLPEKTTGSGWIIIQSSALANLPPEGVRINPSVHAQYMPKILTNSISGSAFSTPVRAHHYRLIGIEVSITTNLVTTGALVVLDPGATTASDYPHHIVIDRSYIHGSPTSNTVRGVGIGGNNMAVIDSYINEIHLQQPTPGQGDAQTIGGWNFQGPLKIVNNYLSAAGEGFIFGGSSVAVAGAVPSDIEIRGNYFYKPLSWRSGDPSYAGIPWIIKNGVEIKDAQRVLMEGNVIENTWASSQEGFLVVLTPSTSSGTAPHARVQDITIRYNKFVHGAGWIGTNWASPGDTTTTTSYPPDVVCDPLMLPVGCLRTRRWNIHNNIVEDISQAKWGGSPNGKLLQVLGPMDDITFEHNTAFEDGSPLLFGSLGSNPNRFYQGFVYRNNIVNRALYGVFSTIGEGTAALNYNAPGYVFQKNVVVGANPSTYPPSNFYPAGPMPSNINFVNYNNGIGGDYHLQASSPYKNAATDGKDVGADIDIVNQMTAGAVSGIWSGGYTPPPPVSDITPPVVSGGSPSGSLPAGTTQATLQVSTNEAATCKYSTSPNTAYSSMANTFTTTGSYSHSATISGLTNGGSYNYYVRCIDTSNNADTADYTITFSVNSITNFGRPSSDITTGWIGSTAPYWSSLDETSYSDADFIRTGFSTGVETAEVKLSPTTIPSVKTGHVLRVRANTDGVGSNTLTYALVQGATVIASANHSLPASPTYGTDSLALTTAQASQITDYNNLSVRLIGNAAFHRIFVSWIELEVPSSGGTTADTTPPTATITAPTANQQLPTGTTSTTLSVATNEAATCKYSSSNQIYDSMLNTMNGAGTIDHTATLTGLLNGQAYTFYVRCQDNSGNKNNASSSVSFSVNTLLPVCGDNVCNNNEDCSTCSADCGICPLPTCDLTSAAWSKTNATEGGIVYLNVFGTNCNGENISFNIFESDIIFDILNGDDPVNTNPQNVVFNGDSVSGTWVAEWQNDGLLGLAGDPEYYFTASVGGSNENIQSGTSNSELLHVNHTIVCGDGLIEGSEQCDNGAQNSVACIPGYGSSCNYCSAQCQTVTIQGASCGDGICNGPETLDSCSVDCSVIPPPLPPPIQDTTPPIATITAPENNQQFPAGTASTTLSVTTNEAATCKYNDADVVYNNMIYTLSGANTTSQSIVITNLQNGTDYTKYVRCIDTAGNAMATSQSINFGVAKPISVCGDNICNGNETTLSCPVDCPSSVCGDGICNASETSYSCPSDCPLVCDLTSATWDTTTATEGDVVYLNVVGNNCNLKTISFEVREYDLIGDDHVQTNPLNVIFTGNSIKGSWIAEWQAEGIGESDPPEYYFTASVAGAFEFEKISSGKGSSELLSVTKTNVCGDGKIAGGEQCDDGDNNGKVCTPDYGQVCGYCSEQCQTVIVQGASCGDGICNGPETSGSCSADCPVIPVIDTTPPTVSASHSPSSEITTSTTVQISASSNEAATIRIFVDASLRKTCDLANSCIYSSNYAERSYSYYADATDSAGNTGTSPTGSFSVLTSIPSPITLAPPSNLSGKEVSPKQINLNWEDNSNNENGFIIESSVNIRKYSWSELARVGVNVNSYSHTNVTADSVNYRVKSYNSEGNSSYSNQIKVRTYNCRWWKKLFFIC